MPLEKMDDFFTTRVEDYDEHMTNNVTGCAEGYQKMANLVSPNTQKLLDLGCGTGLELAPIFRKIPNVSVTGVDMTAAMLEKLLKKYPDKDVQTICASYFDVDFGKEVYDTAVSFQTMHHFTPEKKQGLYTKILKSLKDGGQYIECDYMVVDQADEDFYFAENEHIRKEQGIPEGEFYHYDTPCTIDNQIKLFLAAGFSKAEKVWRKENTTIIVATK